MGIFGHFNVQLDPWQVDYGPGLPFDEPSGDEVKADRIQLDVERPLADWHPLAPRVTASPPLWFVDGVRRMEAWLLVRSGDAQDQPHHHGMLGSYAVGCVSTDHQEAVFGELRVERLAITGGGIQLPERIAIAPALRFDPATTAENDVESTRRVLEQRMRDAEYRLTRELAGSDDRLIIADGPLGFEHTVPGNAVGYIKRHFHLHLPAGQLGLLGRLPVGGRTPLFVLERMKRGRYSWYLRVGSPQPGDSELAGIVRLEVPSHIGLEASRRVADLTASLLPRFAPPRMRDPRAPQNLLPIGALETQLRRRLGDARLVRRHIQCFIAKESLHA